MSLSKMTNTIYFQKNYQNNTILKLFDKILLFFLLTQCYKNRILNETQYHPYQVSRVFPKNNIKKVSHVFCNGGRHLINIYK